MLWTVGLHCAETKTRRVGCIPLHLRQGKLYPNKALWEKRDFTRTAQSIAESEELVARIGRLKLSC